MARLLTGAFLYQVLLMSGFRLLKITLFLVGLLLLALAGWRAAPGDHAGVRLAKCPVIPAGDAYREPAYDADYVQHTVYSVEAGVAHSPTLIEHGDGSLQAIWFVGEDEAEPETGLASARYADGVWSKPEVVLTAESETRERGLFVNTIGNPLLVRASARETWLFYVTPSLGGWATSRISLRKSVDEGRSWGKAHTLRTSPFLNISSLVRQPGVCLENGRIALPLHFELIGHYPKLAILSDEGRVVGQRRMFEDEAIGLQPMVIGDGADMFEAFIRPSSEMAERVYRSVSTDGGLTWSNPRPTELPNPGAPVCAVRLENGGTLMAFNDNPSSRRDFRLAYRRPGEAAWVRLEHAFSENGEGKTYSYCSLLVDRSGRIHLVFSERKEGRIFHAHFSDAWVDDRVTEASGGS